MSEIKNDGLEGEIDHLPNEAPPEPAIDTDPNETAEWLDSLHYVIEQKGRQEVEEYPR